MAERRCSVCNVPESLVGNQVRIVTVDGKDYCETHAPKTQAIPIKEASEEQKLTALAENIIMLKMGQDQQNEYLKSIKGGVTFFVVLMIISLLSQLITSCSG